jgi:hypothetical protein
MIDESDKLRQELINSFWAYTEALGNFLSEGVDRVSLVRELIREDIVVALKLAESLSDSEHKQLFNIWVGGAGYHKYVQTYRKFILALPRDWVLESVEAAAEHYLSNGGFEEYARYLELYLLLDEKLTYKLAQRALAHPDPEIKEVGQDFIEILEDEDRIKEAKKRFMPS